MSTEILALQMLLNEHEKCNLTVDGIYGDKTSDAVDCYLAKSISCDEKTGEEREPATEHFSLKEFYSSSMVDGIKYIRSIKPPDSLYSNIQKTMDMLEKLRHELGDMPITILSGYRTSEYNKYINAADNSAHLRGNATDIAVKGVHPRDVYAAADKLYAKGGVGLYSSFVHVDMDDVVDRPKRW